MFELAPKIGHRGLAARAPENTLAGIRAAHRAGLRWIEVDVRLSADNKAVLSHDATLRRCGGPRVRVRDRTAAQLAAIPVPCGFSRHARECVPALADALDLARACDMGMVLEIKPDPGSEAALARAVRAVLQPDMEAMVSSFSVPVLQAARAAMPGIARAFNCSRPTDLRALYRTGSANLHCGIGASLRIMRAAADAGFGVYVFTVNSVSEARRFLAEGAHGVFTDTGLLQLLDVPDVTAC